jgi:hypothetical protein
MLSCFPQKETTFLVKVAAVILKNSLDCNGNISRLILAKKIGARAGSAGGFIEDIEPKITSQSRFNHMVTAFQTFS